MKRNNRSWKILESLNSSVSHNLTENLEQVSMNSFDVHPNANENLNLEISYLQPTAVEHILDNLEGECILQDTIDIPNSSILTSLQNVSLVDLLNEDLHLSDSSDDYVTQSDECIISSTDCTVSEITNNMNNSSTLSESILTTENIQHLIDDSVELNTTNTNEINSIIPGHQNRKRKRRGQADPSEWKKNIRKNKRQKGEPYLSVKGGLVPGKSLQKNKCMGTCKQKCTHNFSEDERLDIFSSFWNINSIDQKRQYIVSLISREPTIRTLTGKDSRRKMTNHYFFKRNELSEKLNISETYIRNCFKKCNETGVVETDMRGRHTPHNKKSEQTKQFIRDHVNSFPRTPAHYVRQKSKKEYLDQDLNVAKMYNLYKSKCENENRQPEDISYYRKIINTEFNIGFHKPRKDLCDKCFVFNNLSQEDKDKERNQYEEHIKRKVTARQHRNEAKIQAESGEMHFVEYDLEAICNCPSSSSKLIYYKRRIPVYNFTMLDFDQDKRKVFCYCWYEGIGRKGAIEIGSCLLKYLKNKADGKPVTFMSDTCASQCRNMYISALLLYCVEAYDIPEINQKYFEPGHSQMEADNIHATIEQAKRNIPIFHPSGFFTIIRKASRKSPYEVYEMDSEDFIDIKDLKNNLIKNAKIDCDENPVNWLKIKWLQYRKEDNKHIYFKYDYEDSEFKKIKVLRRDKRIALDKIVLKKAYSGPLPISAEKYADLQDLCRQGIIPTQYHDFYRNFKVGLTNDEDFDGDISIDAT